MPLSLRLAVLPAFVVALAFTLAPGPVALAQATRHLRPQPLPEQTEPAPPSSENAPEPEGSTVPPEDPLSHSGGVVAPPPTGDRSVVTPPAGGSGSMPVIPPPGTPGGNPSVQPK
jgi:hypothetical protein